MTKPSLDIDPNHLAMVSSILNRHVPQYEVWAFGSRVTGTARLYSDLDLALITDKPLSWAVSSALKEAFSESDLPWKVDIVDWATTSEDFRRVIRRNKVTIQTAKAM